eukprot:11171002-Alexandrium_andersonii.AAC.1
MGASLRRDGKSHTTLQGLSAVPAPAEPVGGGGTPAGNVARREPRVGSSPGAGVWGGGSLSGG